MSETPKELELQLSVQPSSQPEPERRLQPPPLFQLPLPSELSSETHQQTQLQSELQLSESNPEQQHHAKPVWINHRRLLLFLLGFSLCTAILGLMYYIHQNFQNRTKNQTGTEAPCLSIACQKASVHLSMSTDPFTQPCDYFLFTCGSDRLSQDNQGTTRSRSIPRHPQTKKEKVTLPKRRGEGKEMEDRRLREENILDRKTLLLLYLKEILESNDSRSTAAQKVKGFYSSCLDTKSIDTAGTEPFLTLIQKLGGWAVSSQWNRTDVNSTLSVLMRYYSTYPFFSIFVGKDPNEIAHGTSKTYIQIDQPDLLIPIEWNNKTQKSQAKTQVDDLARPLLI